MAKAFRVVSWNIEHFKGKPERIKKVVRLLEAQKPDVFALYEVEGKDVFDEMISMMPKYQFHITEGRQTQEILVGVKNTMTAFFTQKTEFRSGNQYLRPGAFLTLTVNQKNYSLLFLHTKSSTAPIGLGIRDDQFTRAFKLKKKVLDKIAGGTGKASFIFLGDLNTMGMKYPFDRSIDNATELKKLDKDAKKSGMRRLTKNSSFTWSNGSKSRFKPSDIDHVVATNNINFKQFQANEVDVKGWPKEPTTAKKDKWIDTYSDHAILVFEVQK